MRVIGCVVAIIATCGVAAPVRAQTDVERPLWKRTRLHHRTYQCSALRYSRRPLTSTSWFSSQPAHRRHPSTPESRPW